MAKWLQCQLDDGKVGDQVLIPPAQIDAMRKVSMGSPIGLPGYVPDLMGCCLGPGLSLIVAAVAGSMV